MKIEYKNVEYEVKEFTGKITGATLYQVVDDSIDQHLYSTPETAVETYVKIKNHKHETRKHK